MIERLNKLGEEGISEIKSASSMEKLLEVKQRLLGKKSSLSEVLKEVGKLSNEEKKTVGKRANEIKMEFANIIEEKQDQLLSDASSYEGEIDLTLPGIKPNEGALHPITQMCYDLNDAFKSLGFKVFQEDEITSEAYGFDALNFPPEHPARESMDTYWLKGTEDKKGTQRLCLRPHLTGGSVRYLQRFGAPARFVYPGRVFRNENTDARHERAFFQYEALIVDKDFSFSSGLLMVKTILSKVFGTDVEVRMRAGFFPFVEPGFEIDMRCLVCHGKGCKVCKNVGWIEVMPGGVPHPNVLKSANLDPNEWSGFYINIGLDRLVMMRYGVDDVRLFHSGDLRFLKQFK